MPQVQRWHRLPFCAIGVGLQLFVASPLGATCRAGHANALVKNIPLGLQAVGLRGHGVVVLAGRRGGCTIVP